MGDGTDECRANRAGPSTRTEWTVFSKGSEHQAVIREIACCEDDRHIAVMCQTLFGRLFAESQLNGPAILQPATSAKLFNE